ncbi:MAG TPA: copper resistance system multicopper oxidase [Cellvibrionaceae bacterium]
MNIANAKHAKNSDVSVSRRSFVLGASTTLALTSLPSPSPMMAEAAASVPVLSGNFFELRIGYQKVNFTGTERIATTVNGLLPGPTLRWKEGERVTIRVTNTLKEDSSIHWHGIILPSSMDGSPGFDSEAIKPGATFEYQFDVQQSGTYWYHSHSGLQEQTGLLGSIIIDPKDADPVAYDRQMVVLLSDWSDQAPQAIYNKLKKHSDYYNFRERTLADTWRDIKVQGLAGSWSARSMWNRMRMSERDIADVTGYTYTYLMNGVTPDRGWLGLFKPGEKLRLRIINGAAMSIFDVRIPGLKMTVVAADGQNIQPVTIDEFRIAPAEVYDVIVTPTDLRAYTLFAQTIDRSGYARGTLSCDASLRAEVPAMDPAPVLSHRDMGMGTMDHSGHGMATQGANDSGHDMSNMDMKGMDHSGHDMDMKEMDHSAHNMSKMDMKGMDHSDHDMSKMSIKTKDRNQKNPLAKAGFGNNLGTSNTAMIAHQTSEFGPHVDMRTMSPQSGLADPGIGLRDHQQLYGRRVLRYEDLRSLHPTRDKREPSREIELHLTGNMHRYMWSINGINFMDAAPLQFTYGERVRIKLVNDTMMTHPIHLHGMWSELETGDADFIPRKHTVIVQPGSTISYLLTADAKGRWAYHCHLLYHMLGMMRMVQVI